MEEAEIRPCQPTELESLQRLAWETYEETFAAMNAPETMRRYLEEAFNVSRLRAELENPNSRFFLLRAAGEIVGYLKVNEAPSQTDLQDPESLEVERIYVRKAHKARGLGRALMDHALRLAREAKKRYVWLGVWDQNQAAIGFYRTMGFAVIRTHPFRMGDEVQSDLIMRKDVGTS